MKLTYMKMENLKSILAGMGKSVVEIDFSKGKNDKILLLGKNGSGKSVILSSATPYRGTNDNRSVDPVEGKTGKKIVHFDHNGNKYEIEHFYGKNNKSYIKKNGTELNENGNIRSFNSVMEEELELSQDYFAVGRLGDNVKNFINYPTAERKKYINKFIPNIDDYLIAYKNSYDKVSTFNKRLKSLNVQLEKFNTVDELSESKKNIELRKDEITKNISKNEIKLKLVLDNIESSTKKLKDKNDDAFKIVDENHPEFKDMTGGYLPNIIDTIKKQSLEMEDELDKLYLKYPKLRDRTLDQSKEKHSELESKKELLKVKLESTVFKINTKQSELNDVNSQISENKAKLSSFEDIDSNELKESLEILQERADERKLSLEKMGDIGGYLNKFTLDEAKEFKELIDILKRDLSSISDEKVNLDEELFSKYRLDIDQLVGIYNSLKDNETKLEDEIEGLNKILNDIYKNSGLIKLLEVSKDHEHIKDCPFIPLAVGASKECDNIDQVEGEISLRQQEIKNNLAPKIEILKNHYSYVKVFKESIVNRIYNEYFERIGIEKDDYINTLIKSDTSKYDNLFTIPDKIIDYYIMKNEIDTLLNKIEMLKAKITLNDKIKKDKKDINEKILSLEDKREIIGNVLVDELNPEKEQIEKDIRTNSLSSDIYKGLVSRLEAISSMNSLYNELEDLSNEMKILESSITELRNSKNELNLDIENENKSLSIINTELERANRDYYMVESINKELKSIESVYDDLITVANSLDPKKGIPLIFINNYLTDIAERANSLLDIAYKGNFFIKFDVNEKEFKIIVVKGDGTELEDISLASQGEIAMTNTSLSLSMLANITSGYNILYFDEVDGTLDNDNRRNFLSVLDLQIKSLGSEQAFIISHNNEFYSSDIDLILLDGYESKIDINDENMMSNKTILYKN